MNFKKSIEILDNLTKGVDPYTGEIFNNDHILNNPEVVRALFLILSELKQERLINIYDDHENNREIFLKDKNIIINELNPVQRNIYESLKQWRINKSKKKRILPFNILGDSALIGIIIKNVSKKEELLNIKGIGKKRYELYSDEIINLINDGNSDNIDKSCKFTQFSSKINYNSEALRHGEPWSEQEKIQLLDEYKFGIGIDEISKIHKRTNISIVKSLKKLGVNIE